MIFALTRIPDGGCILADEVGLGKTIEAGLVVAQLLAEGARRVLVVTPKALLGQWSDVARTQARELDRDGAWAAALDTGAQLELARWNEVCDQAQLRRDGLKQTCTALQEKLDELVRVRNLAIQAARDATNL